MWLFDNEKYRFSNCFQRYINRASAELELSPNSIEKYKEVSGRLIGLVGNIDIRKINDETVTQIKKILNESRASPSRKNHHIVVVRNVLKYLREFEGMEIYDFNRIKKYREENRPVEFLTDEEVRILLDSISETSLTRLRLKALIIGPPPKF